MSLFERIMLWGSTALVGVSGIVYAWMKYCMTTSDPYAIVHHPWQPFVLKAHILSAPLLVFAIGLIFLRHIWRQWRSGLPGGRASGLALFMTVVPMALSGALLQTASEESWLFWLAVVHVSTGSAYLVVFGAHVVSGYVRERGEASRVDGNRDAAAGSPEAYPRVSRRSDT